VQNDYIRALTRASRQFLLQVVRAQARTLRLRGSRKLLELLFSSNQQEHDYLSYVGAYDRGIIQIDTRSFIEWWIYAFGSFEGAAIDLLKRLVHPGDIIMDVGANIGAFTLPLAYATGPAGYVHAFEPNPRVRERLRQNVALNNLRNVVVSASALGAAPGETTLYAPRHANQGQGSLSPRDGLDEEVRCTIDTIDHYVRDHSLPRLDLIKIDIEGAELLALQGAAETLRKHRPCIYLEVSPDYLARFGHSARELGEFLRGIGYELWRNDQVERRLIGKELRLTRLDSDHYPAHGLDTYWLAVHVDGVTRGESSSARPG
jgi:FkbM family methyltransferase